MTDNQCNNCGNSLKKNHKACPQCGSKQSKKLSLTAWIIISIVSLVIAGPFLVLFFVPAEPPEDKTALLEQLELENRRSGFTQ
ncbi:MAG: hypothetical protein AB8B95_13640 [Pseudohongiellaceae bacterium]